MDARPGASGVIGVEIAKNAPPDGYTLLLAHGATFALLPALKPKLPYDPDKDFVALSRVASGTYVVAVHPSLGVGTVADLVKLAKARSGQLNYGSSGNGSAHAESPAEFTAFIKADRERIARVVRQVGITLD